MFIVDRDIILDFSVFSSFLFVSASAVLLLLLLNFLIEEFALQLW